jgi:hypothetical protein
LGRTVAELRRTMRYAEFVHWMAKNRIDPIGPMRSDAQAGTIAATLANVHAAKPKFTPSDFMPDYKRAARQARTQHTPESIKTKVSRVMALLGGHAKR